MSDPQLTPSDPAVDSAEQNAEPARRSRRRGRRGKARSAEPRPSQPQETNASAEPQPSAPVSAPSVRPHAATKTETRRAPYQAYKDGLDRFVCESCLRFQPVAWPVHHRKGTATLSLIEVDRRGSELLFCNGLHAGPCTWPDGVVVEATALVERASAVSSDGTDINDVEDDVTSNDADVIDEATSSPDSVSEDGEMPATVDEERETTGDVTENTEMGDVEPVTTPVEAT